MFSSGMAAATTTLLALLKAGDHVVMTSDCYRRTRQFVTTFLARFGITATLVEPGDLAALERALQPGKTKVHPVGVAHQPVPAGGGSAAAGRRSSAASAAPSWSSTATFATPVNQRPLELGRRPGDPLLHQVPGRPQRSAGGRGVRQRRGWSAPIRDLRSVLGGGARRPQRLPAAARDQDAGPAGRAPERLGSAHRPLAGGAAAGRAGVLPRAGQPSRPRRGARRR